MIRSEDLTVADVMTPAPVCLDEDDTLGDAYAVFMGDGIQGAPVIDADGDLLGVLSSWDVLATLAPVLDPQAPPDPGALEEFKALRLRDLVQREPLTCLPGTPLREACRQLVRARVHRLVVVDGRRPIGMFSAVDAVRVLAALGDGER